MRSFFPVVIKVHNSQSHLLKCVDQPKNHPYKYAPTYRATDCAK